MCRGPSQGSGAIDGKTRETAPVRRLLGPDAILAPSLAGCRRRYRLEFALILWPEERTTWIPLHGPNGRCAKPPPCPACDLGIEVGAIVVDRVWRTAAIFNTKTRRRPPCNQSSRSPASSFRGLGNPAETICQNAGRIGTDGEL